MYINHFKWAFLGFKKEKFYSLVSILSLVLGMSTAILIHIWIFDEENLEHTHLNRDRIYQVNTIINDRSHRASVIPLGPGLVENFPEVESMFRIAPDFNVLVESDSASFVKEAIAYIDPSILQVLSLTFVEGNASTAFTDPYNIILTEEIAYKYFGNSDAVGKLLYVGENKTIYKVSGVFKAPHNSNFVWKIYANRQANPVFDDNNDNWTGLSINTYVLTYPDGNKYDLLSKINDWYVDKDPSQKKYIDLIKITEFKLTEIGYRETIKNLSYAIVFILLIALANFVLLQIALSRKRMKNIGLKKLFGITRFSLVIQYILEIGIYVFLSFIISLTIVFLLLPAFNGFTGKSVEISTYPVIYFVYLGVTILICIIASFYPALYFSSLKPINSLKGDIKSGSLRLPGKVSVFVQLIFATIFLIFSFIVHLQFKFMNNADLGFDHSNKMVLYQGGGGMIDEYYSFKSELLKNPDIKNVTSSSSMPYRIYSPATGLSWPGKDPSEEIGSLFSRISPDYFNTLSIELIEGKDLTEAQMFNDEYYFFLSRKAVEAFGLTNPVGQKLTVREKTGEILGVFNTFRTKDFRFSIEPLILGKDGINNHPWIIIDVNPENINGAAPYINEVFDNFNESKIFSYIFLDHFLKDIYFSKTDKDKSFFLYLTVIGMIICLIGIITISVFIAQERTKEIGIRKVHGGEVANLVWLLNMDYVILVFLTFLVSWPLAYYFSKNWLQGFAENVGIQAGVFIASSLIIVPLVIVVITVNTLKTCLKNPVDTLKYE